MSLIQADALRIPLADGSAHMCVTSPPYWNLRDYGVGGQLGLEATPTEYVANMVSVFREVWRVLRDDGTAWLNLGDSYSGNGASSKGGTNNKGNTGSILHVDKAADGLKPKDLCGIPWRVAFALQADGFYLRSDIIWSKPNPMPESVTDRPTKAHEYLFLLAKQERYYYDAEAIKEPSAENDRGRTRTGEKSPKQKDAVTGAMTGSTIGEYVDTGYRNRRTVWTIPTAPYAEAHFATFPPALVEPCILAGTSAAGVCAECGAPWERVTEVSRVDTRPGNAIKFDNSRNDGGRNTRTEATVNTTGWRPTCAHSAPTVPAIVLDPFSGSGTTGAVARLHGRRFVGLDINSKYLRELALPRAEGRQTAASLATLPLFALTDG